MLYGDKFVDNKALKRWSAELVCPPVEMQGEAPDVQQGIAECLEQQLSAFKQFVSNLGDEDDWRSAQGLMSPMLMEAVFKSPMGAIRVANYYECLVVPADASTKKRISSGYGSHTSIGEVRIRKNGRDVGCIGEKSDLIWSVFYEYFVAEGKFGSVEHTLDNHERIMSLQLWDVADGDDERRIRERVNTLLVRLSLRQGLNFKRIQPDELWKSPGESGDYELEDEGLLLEQVPLAYLNYGLTCEDPRMAFLHCYQVLEFFFVRAQNQSLLNDLNASGVMQAASVDHGDLHRMLQKYSRSCREQKSLELVLKKCVNADVLRSRVGGDADLLDQYTKDGSWGSEGTLKLASSDEKLISKLAERIYFFRCSIAHAKGDVGKFVAQPGIDDDTIRKELPLLADIAYQALVTWGRK